MSARELHVQAPVSIEGKAQAMAEVEEFGKENGLPRAIQNEVALILEEWLTNIFSYAKVEADLGIELRASIAGDELLLEIRDSGVAFDPDTAPPPDRTTPLEERAVGGYGIAMMKRLVDEMRWERDAGQNVLRLKKSIRVPKLKANG